MARSASEGLARILGPDHPDTLTGRGNLAAAYESLGRWADAESLRRNALRRRKTAKHDSPLLTENVAWLGRNLVMLGKWSQAEPLIRECLEIRAKTLPDDWMRFNTMSLLGNSLLGQKKYAEAEPLILAGYEGMETREARIPPPGRPRLSEAAERVRPALRDLGPEGQGGRVADQAGEALRRTQAPPLRPRRLEVEEGLSRSYLRSLRQPTEQ